MTMMTSNQQPPAPLGPDLRSHWLLDDSIIFLNHGSFGACPREVLAVQSHWRERMEARPIEFLDRTLERHFTDARTAIAPFLGLPRDDFAFITNATTGVNAAFRSLNLAPGDEIITTNHVYNAVRRTMNYLASRAGDSVREVHIPLPVHAPTDILRAIQNACTARTRFILIDHITSPTALIYPVEDLAAWCRAENLPLFIDGAHAPGMLDLNIASLNCDWYTGNFHKWCCAPKGSAFLYARPDRQRDLHPPTLSHFVNEGFLNEFNWQGTRDVSAWLTVPAAIEWMNQFDWNAIRHHNRQLARWAHQLLCDAWNVEPLSPADGSMLGSMAAIQLPESITRLAESPQHFKAILYDQHHIEVPIHEFDSRWLLRISCQIYNQPAEYEQLATIIQNLAR